VHDLHLVSVEFAGAPIYQSMASIAYNRALLIVRFHPAPFSVLDAVRVR
jgi:hypothetical protein